LAASGTSDSAEIEKLQAEIHQLTQRIRGAETEAKQAKSEMATQFEKMVATFYNGEIRRLPADLNQYEHKVSVEEIRNKAMNYFGISSKELSRIVKKYD
jgi:hypothetical protein